VDVNKRSKANSLQTQRGSRAMSRSAKISGYSANTVDGILDRVDALYEDVAKGQIDLDAANTLNRILGRHVAIMSLAERVDRTRSKSKKTAKWELRGRV
jgi:hypothetical protein